MPHKHHESSEVYLVSHFLSVSAPSFHELDILVTKQYDTDFLKEIKNRQKKNNNKKKDKKKQILRKIQKKYILTFKKHIESKKPYRECLTQSPSLSSTK